MSAPTSQQLRKFYKAREKNPKLYTYDDNGNLIEKAKDGTIISKIQLPSYRKPTFEEFDTMESKRAEAIAKAESDFEKARVDLYEKSKDSTTSMYELLRLNRIVNDKDIILQNTRHPLRWINEIESVEVRNILFDQPAEKRKMGYTLHSFVTRPFTLEEQYTRINEQGDIAQKTAETVKRARPKPAMKPLPVILFSRPDTNEYGYLSTWWPVDIEYKSSRYTSAYQGIMAELAKEFNDQTNLALIMEASTPAEITYSPDNIPGDGEANEIKWNTKIKELLYDINLEKFRQYPELGEKLIQTGKAQLGAIEPDDNILGIGVSFDNPDVQNAASWAGQNLLGRILEQVRSAVITERQAIMRTQKTPLQQFTENQIVSAPIKPLETVVQSELKQIPQIAPPTSVPVRRKPRIAPSTSTLI